MLLILGTGVYELVRPPVVPVALAHLHANLWWGGMLAGIGAVYGIHFAPGKRRV